MAEKKSFPKQKYFDLIKSMSGFTILFDKQSLELTWSDKWHEFANLKTINNNLIKLDDSTESAYQEFQITNNQGQQIWFCCHRQSIKDANNEIQAYIYNCYDINAQKLKINKIIAQDEIYNFAIFSTGVGVWDLFLTYNSEDYPNMDKVTSKLAWNDNMFKLFNVNPVEFQGTYADFERCVHPDDKETVKQQIQSCFQKNTQIFELDFRIISHPNSIRFIHSQAKAEFDKLGRVTRLTGINQDITAKEQEKLHIKQLNRTIIDSESKYRALFECSGDAIVLLEHNLFVECNNAALTMFEYPDKESFLNKHPSELSPPFQADGRPSIDAENDYIQLVLSKGSAKFPWLHTRLNGEVFPAEVLLTKVELKTKVLMQATIRDVTELIKLQERLTFLSFHDQLTGLYNRHALVAPLDFNLKKAKDEAQSLSIMMLDIDDFKTINDTYGHKIGDNVLQNLTKNLLNCVGKEDICVRFGGDEIVVLMPNSNHIQAQKVAKNTLKEIANNKINLNSKDTVQYTVSIGLATFPENGNDQDSLLTAVDKALYAAKNSGKNQIVTAK